MIEFLSNERLRDLAVDVIDRFTNALSAVTFRIAVTQFERLALAGRCARWHRRATERASRLNVGFDSWIASGVQNFSGVNVRDLHDVA